MMAALLRQQQGATTSPSFLIIAVTAVLFLLFGEQQGVHGFSKWKQNGPNSFIEGQKVRLGINEMTSTRELFPIDHYRLPFCKPLNGPLLQQYTNFGELFSGYRTFNSPYRLEMLKDMYCEQLCMTNVGRSEAPGVRQSSLVRAIRKGYRNNWIVDNLPSAWKPDFVDGYATMYYTKGFPIGYVNPIDQLSYIYNHVNIEIDYHEVEGMYATKKEYRIVGFVVKPLSIKHEFVFDVHKVTTEKIATIENPIISCNERTRTEKIHTNPFTMDHDSVILNFEPQLASGKVLFTYDVIWKENKDLSWTSRWDIYVSMNNTAPTQVRWESITNSLVMALFFPAIIALGLVKSLRLYCNHYCEVLNSDKERNKDIEEPLLDASVGNNKTNKVPKECRWTLVHADVFRQPSYPMLISVFTGTGVQLLCAASIFAVFAVLGFLNPARRGSFLTVLITSYILFGGIAGYVTARMYKQFKGEKCQRAPLLTAFGFPSIAFGMFAFMNVLAVMKESSLGIPFRSLIVLLFLGFGILVPLVFFGAHLGFQGDAIKFPVDTSDSPRKIPDKRWLKYPILNAALNSFPFAVCSYTELHINMSFLWMDHYLYDFYMFQFVTFIILVVCVAETSLVFNFCFQLNNENYHWWWQSFLNGGAFAFHIYGYSLYYYLRRSEVTSAASCILYFACMTLICFGLFLMGGSVGLLSCLYFNKTIFGCMKEKQRQLQ